MANQKFSVEEILKEYQSDEATKGKKESPSGKLETQKMLNHAAGRRNVPPSTEASAEAYSYASSRTRQRTPYSPYRSEMAANINQIKQNRYQRRTDVEESRTAAFQTLELMRPKVSFVRSPAIRPQTTPNPKSDHISDYDGAVLLEQPESEQKPEQPAYQPAIQEMQDSTRAKEKKQAQKSRKPKKRTEQSYQRESLTEPEPEWRKAKTETFPAITPTQTLQETLREAQEAVAKAEAEAKAKAEEARKILEAAKKAEEEALKAAEQADSIQIDLTQPAEEGKLPLAASYLEKYTKMEKSGKSLVDTFNAITVDQENRNVCMMGDHGFGLTSVGEDFARSFYDMGICKAKTIAKIKAQALNKVKLADAMSKLAGGCMVVENAGLIAPDKMTELMKLTAKDVNDVVVILTGATESINRLFGATGDAKDKFTHQINMEGISTQDMLAIAKGYFKQQGFKTDDSVEGTVKNLLMAMESGNIDRMLKACDEAMLKCDDREKAKGSSRKYLLSEDFK